MSKELVGNNGCIFGSYEYFSNLNSYYGFDEFTNINYTYNYYGEIIIIAEKIKEILNEVSDDLQKSACILSYIPYYERNDMINLIQGIANICDYVKMPVSVAYSCIQLLNLYSTETRLRSSASESEINSSIDIIRNGGKNRISESECLYLLNKVINYGISYACDKEEKSEFIEEVLQGKDENFLIDILNKYNYEYNKNIFEGKCGKFICCKDYQEYILEYIFNGRKYLKSMSFSDYDYGSYIKNQISQLVDTICKDFAKGKSENDYIKDINGDIFLKIIMTIEEFDYRCYDLKNEIKDMLWFVGGDEYNIKKLQNKLNRFNYFGYLEEDGVYGKKTNDTVNKFLEKLSDASHFSLSISSIDPLQTSITGIKSINVGGNQSRDTWALVDKSKRSLNISKNGENRGVTVFRADKPHKGYDYYHINTVSKAKIYGYKKNKPEYKPNKDFISKLDHTEIPESVYNVLKNFDDVADIVQIGGKVLLISGILAEIVELCIIIEDDLTDVDKKLGKKTTSAIIKKVSQWSGTILGAEAGAEVGALVGTFVLPGLGTGILGFSGSFAGGALGYYMGDKFSDYILDITDLR